MKISKITTKTPAYTISIIVCSIDPARLESFRKKIAATIGENSEYEIIAIDNSQNPRSLAAVYNEGARLAKYPYLLFAHEDAGFISQNWLPVIEEKLIEPDCGVIGFAGTRVMLNVPGGWGMVPNWVVGSLMEKGRLVQFNHDPSVPFTEVVVLDGYMMFVRQDVWMEFPFDEKLLTGFHCYDIDFSLQINRRHKNYVCNQIETFHESSGNFDAKWLRHTLEMHKRKWHKILPAKTSDVSISTKELKRLEERAYFRFIKAANRCNELKIRKIKKFLKYPVSPRHFEHLVKLIFMMIKKYRIKI